MTLFMIAPASLHRLRRELDAAGTETTARILHEAGFATGQALGSTWRNRIAEQTGLDEAGELDARWFGPLLDEMCVDLGWGSITLSELGDQAVLLEAGEWAEALPDSAEVPSCHFTAGALAAFLTGLAGAPVAALEVECRSSGAGACRFLAGSQETLAVAWDLMMAGGDWREAFAPVATD
jgi:predicted hydrocarbon binding protein